MAKLIYNRKSSANPVIRVFLMDSSSITGAGLTGLAYNTTGLRIDAIRELDATVTSYAVASSNVEDITTIGTYAAPTASKCRFKAVDGTNMPGLYEIHLAQALCGTGDASRSLIVRISGATNLAPCLFEVQLINMDLEMAVAQTGDAYAIVNNGTYGNSAIKGYVDDIGVAGAGLTALGDTRLANLDASVSSRLAASSYVAPDNSGISTILIESQSHPTLTEIEASTVLAKEATVSAVKAKTDNLPADPASNTQVNTRLATSGYTAPDNAGIVAIKAKTDTIAWSDITNLLDEALGKWSINKITNVLTIYRQDGVIVLKTFNLTDNSSVSERVPV